MQDAQKLLQVQTCDLQIMRLRKQIEELPEVAQINECRARRKQIRTKRLQIAQVLGDVKDKLEDLETEAQRVTAKMAELQHTLDHNTDFRVTSSALRDFEGQAKRKTTIATEEDEQLERLADLEEKMQIVDGLLEQVDQKEEALTEQLKEKGGALKAELDQLSVQRNELLASIDDSLAARYERLRKEKKGIGIGKLEGRLCSACRTELMDGQYRKLVAGPDLGVCPNCQRLIYTADCD